MVVKVRKEKPSFIAIDLGSSNTLVQISERGIVFNEATTIAYNSKTGAVLAFGDEAEEIHEKANSDEINVVKPVIAGAVNNYTGAEDFLKSVFIVKKISAELIESSVCLISVPSGLGEVERGSIVEVIQELGFKHVVVEEKVKMAALGAGIDIFSNEGFLVVNLGAGTSDAAIVSSGGTIFSRSIRVAGDWINHEIIDHLSKTKGIVIGLKTAKRVKESLSTFNENDAITQNKTLTISGADASNGQPLTIEVIAADIRPVLDKAFEQIKRLIDLCFQQSPVETAGDIIKNGIMLTGGVSQIPGISKVLSDEFGVKVKTTNSPGEAVIRGFSQIEPWILDRYARGLLEFEELKEIRSKL